MFAAWTVGTHRPHSWNAPGSTHLRGGHRGTKEMVSPVSAGISIGTVSSVAHLQQSWQSPSGPTGQVLVDSRRKLAWKGAKP